MLLAFLAGSASATTRTYFGGDNGLWTTATNWNPNGEPVTLDDVFLGSHSAGTADLHVTYDATSHPFSSVTLNSSAISGFMIVNQTGANSSLSGNVLNIGTTVPKNTWNQSAGLINVGTVNIGVNAGSNSGNSYNMSGSGIFLADVNVGVSGAGSFNQSGGTVNLVARTITLGVNAGGVGTYNYSGGSVLGGGTIQVGGNGSGTFNHTGGSSSFGFISVGGSSGVGALNLAGGSLTSLVQSTVASNGTFNQTGGTFNFAQFNSNFLDLDIQAGGVFNLSGGTASGNVQLESTGVFNLKSGGTYNGNININAGGLFLMQGGLFSTAPAVTANGAFRLNGSNVTMASLTGSTGQVENIASGNVTLTLSDPSAVTTYNGKLQNGGSGALSLVKSGGSSQTLGGNNTYTGSTSVNAGNLIAASNQGFSSASTFLVNGGTLDAAGFDVTLGSLGGTGGTVNVGSGSITAGGNGGFTTFGGTLAGTGAFQKVGGGEISFTGGGSYSGDITVQAGNLRTNAVNGIPVTASVNLSGLGTAFNVAANQSLAALTGASLVSINFIGNSALAIGSDNSDTSYGGGFTGGGTFSKVGNGTFTLGLGASDTVSGNTSTFLSFNALAGTLALNKADGTNAVAGPLNVSGGTVQFSRGNQVADNSVVTVNSGAFKLNGFNETVGGLAGTGGIIDLAGGMLTVNQSLANTFSGALTGGGSLIKGGSADHSLSNTSGYHGLLTVNGGRLFLQGPADLTGVSANSGGTFRFNPSTVNLNNGSITASFGGAIEYSGASISNGYLRGSGTQTILSAAPTTFTGVTSFNSTTLNQNGVANFTNFTNGGILNNNSTATFNGVVNASSGVLNAQATLSTQDFTNEGVMNVRNGATVTNTAGNLFLGGGSRTFVGTAAAPGGVISTAVGTTIELNGALLVNNGTINGTTNVNYGSLAKGAGTFGVLNVNDGGRFSPGNSPGSATVSSLTLAAGGRYDFEIHDANGIPGSGIDFIHSLGTLDLTAGNTANSVFTFGVLSLDAANQLGFALNFDSAQAYSFVLVHADAGIIGFTPSEFAIDTSGFQNALGGGSFSVVQQNSDLVLQFNPAQAVPEPDSIGLSLLGGCGLLLFARRFRRGGNLSTED